VDRGQAALRAFEAFEAAAAGRPAGEHERGRRADEHERDRRAGEYGRDTPDEVAERGDARRAEMSDGGHFRRGHGTDIRADAQGRADDAGDPHR
jgi:hypothetical protein